VFHAPNNPKHHPDAPADSFSDPQFRPTNSGPAPGWPVDHPRSLPKPGAAVFGAQAHPGGEWPVSGERR